MSWFENPISFRLREQLVSGAAGILRTRSVDQMPMLVAAANTTMDALKKHVPPPHSSHPSFINLAGLVSEAVLEVVFVALPGFLVAYTGMFDASSQKFVAELNTMVFTPCLIFTKLASQLNADKLSDLAVIPFIFVLQTLVSFVCAQVMARVWGFGHKKMQAFCCLQWAGEPDEAKAPPSITTSFCISWMMRAQRPGSSRPSDFSAGAAACCCGGGDAGAGAEGRGAS